MSIGRFLPHKCFICLSNCSKSSQFLSFNSFDVQTMQQCKKALFLAQNSFLWHVCICAYVCLSVENEYSKWVNLLSFVDAISTWEKIWKTNHGIVFSTDGTLEVESRLVHDSFRIRCLISHHVAEVLIALGTMLGSKLCLSDKVFPWFQVAFCLRVNHSFSVYVRWFASVNFLEKFVEELSFREFGNHLIIRNFVTLRNFII